MPNSAEQPRSFVVGFTGHRHLKDQPAISRIIRGELENLRNKRNGHIAGYTSIAIGADTLFVEACIDLNIPWTASLPFAADEFQKDFTTNEWSHAARLLQQAAEIEVCGTAVNRTAAYLRCGIRTVDQADLVMAVWDGKPARGEGGTGQIVAYARQQNKPLVLIDPIGLEVKRG